MDKLLFKRILVAALTLLAIVYVAYLLISANFEMYPTENAVKTTVTDTISADGFIIREEILIPNDSNGVLSYTLENGAAVDSGSDVAKVFSDEKDAVANSRADAIDAKVKMLEEIQKNTLMGTVSVDAINDNIKSSLIGYLYDVNKYDVDSVKTDSDKLITSINQRQLLTGKTTNFNEQISNLKSQAQSLRETSGESKGSIVSPRGGYFTSICDGYENAYPYDKIKEMTLDDFHNLEPSATPSNTAGKVISNVNWYVACEVSDDDAAALSMYDGAVTVMFSEASTDPVPATVQKISRSEDGNALIILQCDYMDSGLLEARYEPIEIGMGTFSGLRVSKRAIHDDYVTRVTYDENDKAHEEKKWVQGVYVLYGSEIQFKQISILYSGKDYVICNPDPKDKVLFNGETISLYDKVIVKGDDLYDGKVIS